METSGSAEDDDERMKQLEERVLNATKKEEENSEKLNDLDAESERCERRLAKLSLATGGTGGDLMGVKRDKFHSNTGIRISN
jgi:chromosome segregation ATPase